MDMEEKKFTHLDETGKARMVDISDKAHTSRVAIARGVVKLREDVLSAILQGEGPKGDAITVAKIAGIQAAKKTSELIPLTHPLLLSQVDIKFKAISERELEITGEVRLEGKTGAEMEALVAVTVSGLTIYDMCKALDPEMEIGQIYLIYKEGGKSGIFRKETGKIISINLSNKKGTKKIPTQEAIFVIGEGIKTDAHSGPGIKQVSLLAQESINKMREKGINVEPGAFAENVTTEGINLKILPVGTTIYLGDEVMLKVTQLGKECHSPCTIGKETGECVMPLEGIFAEVIKGGNVKVGDKIVTVLREK